MTKQIWVNIKEARLFDQWLNTTLASVKWADLIKFIWEDAKIVAKADKLLRGSELYSTVGKDIEEAAIKLVNEKCKPEWNRISEEMKPLGELRNKLAKEKAEWNWDNEKEAQLNWLDKEMSDLSAEYQKVTDDANKELSEFKDKRIEEEQWACFFLSEKDYKIIGWYAGF